LTTHCYKKSRVKVINQQKWRKMGGLFTTQTPMEGPGILR